MYDRQPRRTCLGSSRGQRSSGAEAQEGERPGCDPEWVPRVAARDAVTVVSVQRRHRRRTVWRYRWDAATQTFVEVRQTAVRSWRPPLVPLDRAAVAYMKPSSKRDQRATFVIDYADSQPKTLTTFPLEEHPGWYQEKHRKCFYAKAVEERGHMPARFMRHGEAAEVLIRAGRFGAGAEHVRFAPEIFVPLDGVAGDFGDTLHRFRSRALASLHGAGLGAGTGLISSDAFERAALDAVLDRTPPRMLVDLITRAKAMRPDTGMAWVETLRRVTEATTIEKLGPDFNRGDVRIRTHRWAADGGATAAVATAASVRGWRRPASAHRACLAYVPPRIGQRDGGYGPGDAEKREAWRRERDRIIWRKWSKHARLLFYVDAAGVPSVADDPPEDDAPFPALAMHGEVRLDQMPPEFQTAYVAVFGAPPESGLVESKEAVEVLIRASGEGLTLFGPYRMCPTDGDRTCLRQSRLLRLSPPRAPAATTAAAAVNATAAPATGGDGDGDGDSTTDEDGVA